MTDNIYCVPCKNIWDKVFKNGPSEICGRQPLKNLVMVCLNRPYHFKFFKGCLPQISLGPFLNTLSHLFLQQINVSHLSSFANVSVNYCHLKCNGNHCLHIFIRSLFVVFSASLSMLKSS